MTTDNPKHQKTQAATCVSQSSNVNESNQEESQTMSILLNATDAVNAFIGHFSPLVIRTMDASAKKPKDVFVFDSEKVSHEIERTTNNVYFYLNIGTKTNTQLKDADIVSYRGVGMDFDKKNNQTLPDSWENGIAPTYMVETSAGSFQVFWLFETPQTMSKADYTKQLKRLKAHYNCDQNVGNPAQFYRLPGSINRKDGRDNFRVTVTRIGDFISSFAQILPPVEQEQTINYGEDGFEQTYTSEKGDAIDANYLAKQLMVTLACLEAGNIESRTHELIRQFATLYPTSFDMWGRKFASALMASDSVEDFDTQLFRVKHAYDKAKEEPSENPWVLLTTVYKANAKVTPNTELTTLYRLEHRFPNAELKFNEMKLLITKNDVEFEEEAVDKLRLDMLAESGDVPSAEVFCRLVVTIAKKNKHNPVKDYLNSLDTASVDAENFPAFNTVLNEILKITPDRNIEREFVKRFLISMVARGLNPGCDANNALVFQGEQGAKKTTFFRNLVPPGLFQTITPDSKRSQKDELMERMGFWLVELGELETSFSKKEIGEIKNDITRPTDTFRPPYARNAQTFKRQYLFCATVNQGEFLVDTTGNRRFLVVIVPSEEMNVELLAAIRDELWAEIKVMYERGDVWWFSKKENDEINKYNVQFMHTDVVEEQTLVYAERHATCGFTLRGLQKEVFGEDIDQKNSRRLADILRKHSFVDKRMKRQGKVYPTKYWFKGGVSTDFDPEQEEDLDNVF